MISWLGRIQQQNVQIVTAVRIFFFFVQFFFFSEAVMTFKLTITENKFGFFLLALPGVQQANHLLGVHLH